jgi:predicted 3-demethylubiquinone-9 3-methyltransferase (glyoxalase superfamily)
MQHKISHCLWFDRQAEDAAKFYVSVFKDGRLGQVTRYTEEGFEIHGMPKGTVMSIEFEIAGQRYVALNGGPLFRHSEAFSIVVNCETQEEIDRYWAALTQGGEEVQCGWLKDRFGVSWQVTPTILREMMADRDPEKVRRVTHAFLRMKKYDIAALKRAYEGKG